VSEQEAPTAKAVLEHVVGSLVDDPDSVTVDPVPGRRRDSITFEVNVAPGDMGRVIGRRGRIAQSVRALVRAASAKDGVEADVDFVD
jgi:uncharacterized protein